MEEALHESEPVSGKKQHKLLLVKEREMSRARAGVLFHWRLTTGTEAATATAAAASTLIQTQEHKEGEGTERLSLLLRTSSCLYDVRPYLCQRFLLLFPPVMSDAVALCARKKRKEVSAGEMPVFLFGKQ